jgi:hypothetical protein
MSLSTNNGKDVAYVTAEEAGLTSLVSAGYSGDIRYELVGTPGEDPFEPAVNAVSAFARAKDVNVICLDGASVICGRAVTYLTGGEDKADWETWRQVLSGFVRIEEALDKASRLGKSVVVTAWEQPPVYEDSLAGRTLKEAGSPWIQGKGKIWLPGNADIIGHLTSKMEKKPDPKTKKMVEKWSSKLQVHPSEEWVAKTRLPLPMYAPANLRTILEMARNTPHGAAKEQ